MFLRELDRALGVLRRAHQLQLTVALDDRLDESTGEGIVVGDDQTEGHLRLSCTPSGHFRRTLNASDSSVEGSRAWRSNGAGTPRSGGNRMVQQEAVTKALEAQAVVPVECDV